MKKIVITVIAALLLSFAPALASTPVESVLGFVPGSPVFMMVSQNTREAYNNFTGYGFTEAFPKLGSFIADYERKTGIRLAEEASLTDAYVMALTAVNPLLFDFEFISAIHVTDAGKYEMFLEKWLSAWNITKNEVTRIDGEKVFTLSSAEIKTPVFFLRKGEYFISSNKLEGISKALDTAASRPKSFLATPEYTLLKRKYDIDSNFYVWISGKVVANYLNLVMATPAFMKMSGDEKFSVYAKLLREFTAGLEFIAIKKQFNSDNFTGELFVSVNELLSKTMKARLELLRVNERQKLSYTGALLEGLRYIPEKATGLFDLHAALPPFEELMSGQNANSDQAQLKNLLNFRKVNENAVKKFGVGLDKLVMAWTGNEFFGARLGDRKFVAGAKIAKASALADALDRVEARMGSLKYRKTRFKHSGTAVTVATKYDKKKAVRTYAYFTAGDFFVVASDPDSAKLVIDTWKDRLASVRASREFVGACDYASGTPHKLIVYGDLRKAIERVAPYLGGGLNIVEIAPEKLNLRRVGITNTSDASGQRFRVRVTY